jgi:hypothetical protein
MLCLSKKPLYVDDIVGGYQCGFQHNCSDTVHCSDAGERQGIKWLFTDTKNDDNPEQK